MEEKKKALAAVNARLSELELLEKGRAALESDPGGRSTPG